MRTRNAKSFGRIGRALAVACVAGLSANAVRAAGTLTPVGSADQPIRITDHQVNVTISNGFARTEVTQTFANPNARDLEAVYSFPLPRSASLSEVTVWNAEKEIRGEVVEKQTARRMYEQEKSAGNEAAIADKNAFYTFDFSITPVRAGSDCKVQFVYYQPLEIDTGVGRYVYPLREGGTDDAANSFWSTNTKIDQTFSANIELKSVWPVTDVRVPGWISGVLASASQEELPATQPAMNDGATHTKLADGHWKTSITSTNASLDRDLVLYYKLADNLPGRIEMVTYRPDKSKPGTFMMVLTPGLDLKPITTGADYMFVLDTSGSMQTKIHTLADGVTKSLGKMKPADRFRVITFNNSARQVIPWTPASPQNVKDACETVQKLQSSGSTNMFDGVKMALSGLDDDRATSIVLVTDGVTNTGVVDPAAFDKLMRSYDVRVFGFLMGNSANWPLMRTVCDATGGFYAGVSNDDDIVGQIMLAKNKITHEALHDAKLKITGVESELVSEKLLGKVYSGQQLVIFGRYEHPGRAKVTLSAKLTGEDKTYSGVFDLPEIDTANPEIERLWALDRIEQVEAKRDRGEVAEDAAKSEIMSLGLGYQLVTDFTSMVVLSDEAFAKNGVERNNQQRVVTERAAQATRATQPPANNQIDKPQPAFDRPAPSIGNNGNGKGGGAIDPISGLIVFGGGAIAAVAALRSRTAGRRGGRRGGRS